VEHASWRQRVVSLIAAGLCVAVVGCSEPESSAGDTTDTTGGSTATTTGSGTDGQAVLAQFQGRPWFDGEVPAPEAADTAQPPVRLGFMNVDAGPIGALPELHAATDAAVALVNGELGGVGGRPIEIVPCLLSNPLSPDEAQACARSFVDNDVVAVLGGIGLSNGAALTVLEDNGIPYVGGIPVNDEEMTSPVSFQFSGGSPGAFVAFAQDAVEEQGAEKVAVMFAEFPSIQQAAVGYGAATAEALGAEVTEVSFPMASQDYSASVQKAVEADPDAIFVGAADLACAPIMQALADLQTEAQVYMVGACADVKQLDKVGEEETVGIRFNVEGRIDTDATEEVDSDLYVAAMERYAPGTTPRSAATVAFRSAMNLWAVLDEIGPDATREQVIDRLRAAEARPSFDGHPYTCDGQQIPALPAMCAPQEVIAELMPGRTFTEASDGWIDVPGILARTGVGASAGSD
jgi:branched-chain amino acid transport system substrate-binding protein